jgi:hypothetical protein
VVEECHGGGLLVQRHTVPWARGDKSHVYVLSVKSPRILEHHRLQDLANLRLQEPGFYMLGYYCMYILAPLIHPLATRPGSTVGCKSPSSSFPPSSRDNH